MYRRTPGLFEGRPSRFARWSRPRIRKAGPGARVLELGCGPGRDARYLADAGFRVHAVDHAAPAIARARALAPRPPNLTFELAEARAALERQGSGTFDAVYAHALYMMLPDRELARLLGEVHRVLRPGGLHLFAVRASTDPRTRAGREVASGVWRGGPHRTPFRYFRARTLDTLTGAGFVRVARRYERDARLWFVCDRRP